jgi:hypothetical protein
MICVRSTKLILRSSDLLSMPGLVASGSPEASSTRCSDLYTDTRCLLYLKDRAGTQRANTVVSCALMQLERKTARELTLAIDCACEMDRLGTSMECSKVHSHRDYD